MNSEDNSANSSVDSKRTPSPASIDSIIGWLKERRSENPSAPLSRLLQEQPVQADCLIDLACLDLMERRRSGQGVRTEDYLEDFPELLLDAARLDLIDAEICVARELGESPNVAHYANRFPDLRGQIVELLEMNPVGRADLVALPTEPQQGVEDHPHEVTGVNDRDAADPSLEFSLAQQQPSDFASASAIVIGNEQRNSTSSVESPHPIDIPEWFVGEQCVASGPGHWLIRGRDAQHGETLAMKVIELPVQITAAQVDEMLDACEKAAKVQHPAWVVPAVAAVQQRHLAVVRPWIFANTWQHFSHTMRPALRLQHLASIAYALQSAHRARAAHGAVQPSNLLIDHEGKIHVVDGCSGTACVRRWLSSGDGLATWAKRQTLDVQDLIKLVVSDAVDWPPDGADRLVTQLRRIAEEHNEEACGRIGDALMRWVDQQPADASTSRSAGNTLRGRIARWISREGS